MLQRQCLQGRPVSDEQQADIRMSLNFDFRYRCMYLTTTVSAGCRDSLQGLLRKQCQDQGDLVAQVRQSVAGSCLLAAKHVSYTGAGVKQQVPLSRPDYNYRQQ